MATKKIYTEAEIMLIMMDSKHKYVRRCAVEHPDATPEILLKAIEDEDKGVRLRAAVHPNATPEILLKAIEDKDSYVRLQAAMNPNTKKLDLTLQQWLNLVSDGIAAKHVPSWVKKTPEYKTTRSLSELAKS